MRSTQVEWLNCLGLLLMGRLGGEYDSAGINAWSDRWLLLICVIYQCNLCLGWTNNWVVIVFMKRWFLGGLHDKTGGLAFFASMDVVLWLTDGLWWGMLWEVSQADIVQRLRDSLMLMPLLTPNRRLCDELLAWRVRSVWLVLFIRRQVAYSKLLLVGVLSIVATGFLKTLLNCPVSGINLEKRFVYVNVQCADACWDSLLGQLDTLGWAMMVLRGALYSRKLLLSFGVRFHFANLYEKIFALISEFVVINFYYNLISKII